MGGITLHPVNQTRPLRYHRYCLLRTSTCLSASASSLLTSFLSPVIMFPPYPPYSCHKTFLSNKFNLVHECVRGVEGGEGKKASTIKNAKRKMSFIPCPSSTHGLYPPQGSVISFFNNFPEISYDKKILYSFFPTVLHLTFFT